VSDPADDPIKVGAVVYEYNDPASLGVVEEVELEKDGPRVGTVKFARVRWITWSKAFGKGESRNAPAGQNWCGSLFLRVADPIDALAAIGGVHRKPEG